MAMLNNQRVYIYISTMTFPLQNFNFDHQGDFHFADPVR